MPMLAAVCRVAERRGVPVRVAVEEAMACGTGVCWTCVLPVEKQGRVQNLRACTEGPVFNGAQGAVGRDPAGPDGRAAGPAEVVGG